MDFNFPSLTPGYIGFNSNKLTLNSHFYYLYHSTQTLPDQYIFFPQRVAKVGFFNEISNLETETVRKNIFLKKQFLLQELQELARNMNVTKSGWLLVNHLNLLLRYGLFDEVSNFICPHDVSYEISLEINLIKINSTIHNELSKSHSAKINIVPLFKLVDEVYKNKNIDSRLRIIAINLFVVYYCRFNHNQKGRVNIQEYGHVLLTILENHDSTTLEKLRSAIALRGIAMINDYGEKKQNEYLIKSLEISNTLDSELITEKILIKENIYTLSQTLSKWSMQQEDLVAAKKYLIDMITIDPFDSTGFGAIRCTHLLRQKPALILKFKFLQSTQHSNWTGRAFTAIPIPST